MELLWIPITLCAACAQVARTGLQKSLTAEIGNISATWVRSVYALPFLPLLWWGLAATGEGMPALSAAFIFYCFAAALAQIIATFLLLVAFQHRNFAVGTVFGKTEALQVALLGILIFAQPPSLMGFIAICIGGLGVFLLLPWHQHWLGNKGVVYGLAAGFFFALTTWFVHSAYPHIPADALSQAVLTVSTVVIMQSILLAAYLCWRRADFFSVWRVRRRALATGALSLLGSLGWFWAFALTNPAYVKTLAQIELPLAYILGRAVFSETTSKLEIAGMTIACVGAALVAFA